MCVGACLRSPSVCMSRLAIAAAVVLLMILTTPVSAIVLHRLSSRLSRSKAALAALPLSLSRSFLSRSSDQQPSRSNKLNTLPRSFVNRVSRSSQLPFRRLLTLTALAGMASSATSTAVPAAATPAAPREFFRKDYEPSAFQIPDIRLSFQLGAAETHVTATSSIVPATAGTGAASPAPDLVLDGEDSIELLEVKIDGAVLAAGQYSLLEGKLRIPAAHLPAAAFTLETRSRLQPDKNLALSGLYSSGPALLCTQCEAMGFRRIAFHLDRPDVLSRYMVGRCCLSGCPSLSLSLSLSLPLCCRCLASATSSRCFLHTVSSNAPRPSSPMPTHTINTHTHTLSAPAQVRLEASESAYPLLLSNGNKIASGALADGRHFALWEDPFPKPSYLFALVAGDLGGISSSYVTTSGRTVQLGIFSDKENAGKVGGRVCLC